LLFALCVFVSLSQAQDSGGGCCFYAGKNFENEIACSGQPFRTTTPVQSWFCTETYAAYLQKNGVIQAPALCADVLAETTRPVEVDEIHVFTPCPRFSDCCFYTEENLQGEEFCIPSRAPPQPDKLYRSYQCLPGWKPQVNNRAALPCPTVGTGISFGGPVKQLDIDIISCDAPARAENFDDSSELAVFEEVDVPFENTNDDVSGFGDNNMAASDSTDNVFGFEATDDTINQAVVDPDVQLVDTEASLEDPNVAFAVADSDFVEFANEDGAAAMSGATETLGEQGSGSNVVATFLAVLVSVAFFLA